jgi:hypothetical protein
VVHVQGGWDAFPYLLLQAPAHDALEVRGEIGAEIAQGSRAIAKNG